jgi:hypothetical protein
MEVVGRIAAGVAGIGIILGVLDAVVRTFVLPRGARVRLVRLVARTTRALFGIVAPQSASYDRRDRVLALFAPITLLAIAFLALGGVLVGFALAFMAIEDVGPSVALRWSGSAVFTLGYSVPSGGFATALVFCEAAIGLGLLALLIAYLPSIYSAFSRREATVTHFSVRAGTPPSAVELLMRARRAEFLHGLDPLFESWEAWFVDLEETHTTFVSLVFFRSPNPHRSWITAAGAMLDTAALRLAVLDEAFTPSSALCLRSGFLALRAIADLMGIAHDPDPAPTDPISISRDEFDAACAALAEAGVALVADRDAAWAAFVGWRVNYDTVLIEIARRLVAPVAPWSSDGRSLPPPR